MASSLTTTPLSFSGCDSQLKAICLPSSTNFNPIRKNSTLKKSNRIRKLSVSAGYSDGGRRSGDGDFFAGFVLGGAVFGTMAYIFAPEIRRWTLKQNDAGFAIPPPPTYYDEGLANRRKVLNDKVRQLNSAIDKVSSRLKDGGEKILDEKISQINSTIGKVSSRLRGEGSGSGKDNSVPAETE